MYKVEARIMAFIKVATVVEEKYFHIYTYADSNKK